MDDSFVAAKTVAIATINVKTGVPSEYPSCSRTGSGTTPSEAFTEAQKLIGATFCVNAVPTGATLVATVIVDQRSRRVTGHGNGPDLDTAVAAAWRDLLEQEKNQAA